MWNNKKASCNFINILSVFTLLSLANRTGVEPVFKSELETKVDN